ncbi:hypothetical protein [Streptomyces sp. 351MFTsu5.1]|uniref:hypothetical protein n=1 Tax=Streptomyces sp. 351MFTsu5.1 TaxID=1172180 RepID=UPI0003647B8A|nr:hypothetical protein [Streptomyces sp. 351MFTsu5.1]
MIAFPRTPVPVPDAVADLSARQLPPHIRQAVKDAADAGRSLSLCRLPRYEEGRQRALASIARANKQLAAHNPHRMYGWEDLPGLQRKEA